MVTETTPVLNRSGPGILPYTFKSGPHSSHGVILRLLPERGEGRRLLDLGCGPGYLSSRLAARGFLVTAVDRVPPEEIPAGVQFLPADLNALDRLHLDDRFHFVILADVLEHVVDPARLLAWSIGRLEKAGRLLISVPNVAHLYVRLNLLLGRFPYADRGILDRTHLHFYTRKSFQAFLVDCGLRILDLRATPVPFELLVAESRRGVAFRVFQSLNAVTARLFPRLLAYQFVCLAAPARSS